MRLLHIAILTVAVAMGAPAFADDDKGGAKPVALPPALDALRMPAVEQPDAFVEKTLTQYRDDLATFEAMLEALGEQAVEPPDEDALLQAAAKRRPEPKILTASVIDDREFAAPTPIGFPANRVFIDRLRITAGRPNEQFAADARTAAALNIRDFAGIKITGDVSLVSATRTTQGCCASARRHDDGSVISQFGDINCLRFHQVPVIERRKGIDIRELIGSKITFDFEGSLSNGGIGGFRPAAQPGVQTLIAKIQQGRVPKTQGDCQPFGGKVALSFNPGPVREQSVRLNVVKLGEVGVLGIDPVATTDGRFAPKHYFGSLLASRGAKGRFTLGEGAGRNGLALIRDVVGKVVGSDGVTRFSRLSASLREIGVGPFEVSRSRVSLPARFRPGTSKLRWRLPGDVEIIEHAITASLIDIEIDEEALAGPPKDGETYTASVVIDGPAELNGFTLDWGGSVNWLDTPSFERKGKKQVATNRFFAPPLEDKFPTIEIAMSGPDGEVFKFSRGIRASVEALEGLSVLAEKGSLGQPTEPKTALDFFFPTADPASAMHARIAPTLQTGRGPLEILTEDPQSEVVQAHQARVDRLVVLNDESVLRGKPVARLGFIELAMAPAVASAKAAVQVGGPAFDPENRLGLPNGKAITSDVIDLTVNSVRLLRRGGGFDLAIRGAADMSQYQARWHRKGLSPTTTGFEATDDGAVAKFDTRTRLTKVEIVQGGDVHATILGVQATVAAQIKLLPFDSPINEIERAALRDFGDIESLDECIGTVTFGINFMEFDTGGLSARDFCKAERKNEKAKIREDREAGKERNDLIRGFEKQGKELIALSDAMNVAALIRGLPSGEIGRLVCIWTISNGGPGLKTGARASAVQRTGPTEGVCVNRVTGIRQGFAPGAKLKVSLVLDDRPTTPKVSQTARLPIFDQQENDR